jgi:hypothetical protein
MMLLVFGYFVEREFGCRTIEVVEARDGLCSEC